MVRGDEQSPIEAARLEQALLTPIDLAVPLAGAAAGTAAHDRRLLVGGGRGGAGAGGR
jgi:hypothetical protein